MSLLGVPKIIQAHDHNCLSLGVLLNFMIFNNIHKANQGTGNFITQKIE